MKIAANNFAFADFIANISDFDLGIGRNWVKCGLRDLWVYVIMDSTSNTNIHKNTRRKKMKAIEIRNQIEANDKMINTSEKAKKLYNSLKDGESVFFLFCGDFDEQKKIFKRDADRLIVGDVFPGKKVVWSDGFTTADWS